MDRLARNAMLAKQAGMSYGKWKTMQEPVKVVKPECPEGWRKCEHCGKPFKPVQGKRFCDIYCRERAYYEKGLAIKREYRNRKKAGATNE